MNLIINTTAGASSTAFNINTFVQGDAEFAGKNYPLHTTFRITGGVLGAAEYVLLEYKDETNWRVANIDGNEGKLLDSDNSVATIYGRMINARLSKTATATALGVEVV